MQKLNFKKLRQDMSIVSNKIRFLRANNKYSLYADQYHRVYADFINPHATGKNISGDDLKEAWNAYWAQSLPALREQMTALCSIRAQHHGRLHLTKIRNPHSNIPGEPKYKELTVADQERLIAKFIDKYLIINNVNS